MPRVVIVLLKLKERENKKRPLFALVSFLLARTRPPPYF